MENSDSSDNSVFCQLFRQQAGMAEAKVLGLLYEQVDVK